MARHNDTGKRGEDIARKYLERKGYEILATNWRFEKCEVDLICKVNDTIVFTEVKTRNSDSFGMPEEKLSPKQLENYHLAAEAWLETVVDTEPEIRFDIIAIIMNPKKFQIHHIEDAFFPNDHEW